MSGCSSPRPNRIASNIAGICNPCTEKHVFRHNELAPLPAPGRPHPGCLSVQQNQEQMIGDLHYWVATAIIILACGHAGAALFHQYVLRDGLLRRMLPTRNSGKRGIVRAL